MNLSNQLSHLISMESEKEIHQLIVDAPEESLGDLLHTAVCDLSITATKKILARQPDVMKLLTVKGFSKLPTPVHFYLCDDFDFFMFDEDDHSEERRLEILQLLLDHKADPNWTGKNGSVLDTAIGSKHKSLIKCLLAAGADINQPKAGSALNTAIRRIDDTAERLSIMKLLLDAGADINGDAKHRPLFTAAHKNQIDTIEFLLNAGADLHIINEKGESLLDIACKNLQHNIIDLCATHDWFPNTEQQHWLEYSNAAKVFDYSTLMEVSKKLTEHRLDQTQMVSFSYAATQLQQHDSAIAWAEKAVKFEVTPYTINRYIAAFAYAAKFTECVEVFHRFENQVSLKQLNHFAQANLLVAALKTDNQPLINIIFNMIGNCSSRDDGAGLLYFNAACIASLNNQLREGFKFLVAARINQFNTKSIDSDPDLKPLRELPEFSVLQNWNNPGKNFYICYDNDKELWYFQDELWELDFAEQICEPLLELKGSVTEQTLAICYALLDYQQRGFNPVQRISIALNSIVEDITLAIIELLDTEEDFQYEGIRFYTDPSDGPLAIHWCAQGLRTGESYGRPFRFDSYTFCELEMFQVLISELKQSTAPLFTNRPFYIELTNPDTYEDERIALGR